VTQEGALTSFALHNSYRSYTQLTYNNRRHKLSHT